MEALTATRMGTLAGCMRRHFWRYELGLRPESDAMPLRFGSAWHRAMEARWNGLDFEAALEAATKGAEFEELQLATLAGLLAGYYARYEGEAEQVAEIFPECAFAMPIERSRTFEAAGKIDGLGRLRDGRLALIEHKTASDSLDDGSDYWLRLRLNPQVLQYVLAARAQGWEIEAVLYDVARKPMIAPLSAIPVLDEQGRKIVLDAGGNRVLKKDGAPRESGDKEKGYALQTRAETSEEFGERLAADTRARPEFYFARREVPVLDADLAEFEVQRYELGKLILALRQAQKRCARPEQAWPRNINALVCRGCEYAGFCLQNAAADAAHIPAGFAIGEVNPELTRRDAEAQG
ncbi:MAG: PD-(D/E)XK nuclease family protein [Lentisphaerae bacterium]|nr:PD-(D/E)XK nuclease family protein [Lentisphaerota bacterium]